MIDRPGSLSYYIGLETGPISHETGLFLYETTLVLCETEPRLPSWVSVHMKQLLFDVKQGRFHMKLNAY